MKPADIEEKATKYEENQVERSDSVKLMRVGTAIIIGAVAANVIGFRYSRWAVGKELYRGWQRRQPKPSSTRKYPSSSAAADSSSNLNKSQRYEDVYNWFGSSTGAFKEFARQAQSVNETRRRETPRQKAGETSRNASKKDYQEWERKYSGFGDSDQNVGRSYSYPFEFDSVSLESLLRELNKSTLKNRRWNSRVSQYPDVEAFEELLQSARNAHKSSTSRAKNSQTFEFWEEIFRDSGNGQNKWFQGWSAEQDGYGNKRQTWSSNQQMDFRGFDGQRSRALATFGLSPDATDLEIKAAHRREVLKWHPDKYKGSDPEFASQKFREATAAYDTLMKQQ